jgi:hypothetical protein
LIGDDKDLKSDIGDLSREEMRERLYVAEKVMKTLFKRNRELEESNEQLNENTHPSLVPECSNCQDRRNKGMDH